MWSILKKKIVLNFRPQKFNIPRYLARLKVRARAGILYKTFT